MTLFWARTASLALASAALDLSWDAADTYAQSPARSPGMQAIVRGAASPDDGAIVALLTDARRLGCTGTLIRPHVVLTGAHCIDTERELPSDVFLGADLASQGTAVKVVKRLVHPEFAPDGLYADLALLGVEGDLEINPIAIERNEQPVGDLNLEVRVVGYGCTDLADLTQGVGLRRAREDLVTELTQDHKLRHSDSTCRGDSGGPVLIGPSGSERLLGVSSSGGSKAGLAFSLATSVPHFGSWIDGQADQMEDELGSSSRPSSANNCSAGAAFTSDVGWPLWIGILFLGCAWRAILCRSTSAPRRQRSLSWPSSRQSFKDPDPARIAYLG